MKFFARNWHLAWVIYSYLEEKSIIVIKCANFFLLELFWVHNFFVIIVPQSIFNARVGKVRNAAAGLCYRWLMALITAQDTQRHVSLWSAFTSYNHSQ